MDSGHLDISEQLDRLCADLCRKVPELGHIDPARILFCLSRSRAGGTHGTYARIAPLRFACGESEQTRRRGRYLETYRLPAMNHAGRDILYLVYILFPRFLRLSFHQRLTTVIHELYHVSERCDGDIRRFAGRNFAHGSSRQGFNRKVEALAERYLATRPDPELLGLLNLGEKEWREGAVQLTGLKVPLPRARLVARRRL